MPREQFVHIYACGRWRKLRAYKLRLDPLCEYCPADRKRPATEVDHWQAIADGGAPYDLDNLRSACKTCHSQKTKRGERLHGCDANGVPRDARHWWNAGGEGAASRG